MKFKDVQVHLKSDGTFGSKSVKHAGQFVHIGKNAVYPRTLPMRNGKTKSLMLLSQIKSSTTFITL